jgi:hypothetical protein
MREFWLRYGVIVQVDFARIGQRYFSDIPTTTRIG